MGELSRRSDELPSASDHFQWMRNDMGAQQTLMSATRTAVMLIGLGFAVAEYYEKIKMPVALRLSPEAARNLGIALIVGGVIILVVFTWQYHVVERYLRSDPFAELSPARRLHSASFFAAWVVLLIGVIAVVSVLRHF